MERKIIITLLNCLTIVSLHAQADLSSLADQSPTDILIQNDDTNFSIGTASQYITTVSEGDTVGVIVSMGEVEATPNTEYDTISVYVLVRIHQATSATLKVKSSNYNESKNIVLTEAGYASYTVKLSENKQDTILLINESGDDIKLDFVIMRYADEVISNIANNLFGKYGISFQNPVSNNELSFYNIPSDFVGTEVVLISTEGQRVVGKYITSSDNKLDLSNIPSGLYILQDQNSGSSTKVIIQ